MQLVAFLVKRHESERTRFSHHLDRLVAEMCFQDTRRKLGQESHGKKLFLQIFASGREELFGKEAEQRGRERFFGCAPRWLRERRESDHRRPAIGLGKELAGNGGRYVREDVCALVGSERELLGPYLHELAVD